MHGGRIDAAAVAARADTERAKLRSMVDYAYATGCRRRYLLSYFGDEEGARALHCGRCDVCSGTGKPLDETARFHVRAVLSLASTLAGRFGRARLAALLAGDDEEGRFRDLAELGMLKREGVSYARDLVRALEGAGHLAVSRGEYPTVSITASGKKVLRGEEEARLMLPGKAPRARARRKRA